MHFPSYLQQQRWWDVYEKFATLCTLKAEFVVYRNNKQGKVVKKVEFLEFDGVLTNDDWSSGIACHVRTTLFWVITQHSVVIPYWRLKVGYRFHLQGTGIQKESQVTRSGVYIRKSVGADEFSVAWC